MESRAFEWAEPLSGVKRAFVFRKRRLHFHRKTVTFSENDYFFFKYLYMFWPITYIVTETEGLRELFYFWLDDREKASRSIERTGIPPLSGQEVRDGIAYVSPLIENRQNYCRKDKQTNEMAAFFRPRLVQWPK